MPEIYLYAEILTHIRQLTLYASLQTIKNEHTKILVSSDKKIITALHDGDSSSIYLPTQISGTAEITFPLDKKTEISARVQIEDIADLKSSLENANHIDVPWSASDLESEVGLLCKDCGCSFLAECTVSTWKDLPSANWAELMDFWFCHKPHSHDDNQDDSAAAAKGFSARSKLAVSPHTGLTDTVSFLLHADDCMNLKVRGRPMFTF